MFTSVYADCDFSTNLRGTSRASAFGTVPEPVHLLMRCAKSPIADVPTMLQSWHEKDFCSSLTPPGVCQPGFRG